MEKEWNMYRNYINEILSELCDFLCGENVDGHKDICSAIENANNIFIAGVGRTGYIMRCFSMRLAQAGFRVYWIGDCNTCSAKEGDLLILGSGSGETDALVAYIKKAARLKIKKIVFTTDPQSTLGNSADFICVLKADAKYQTLDTKNSIQPMGSLFEEALLITLESIFLELMERNQITEEYLRIKHANFE